MSTRLVGWALRDAPMEHPDLSMGSRLLLVYLADHFNEDTGACFPSQSRLASLMSCSERSIRNYLDELVNAGIISKTFRKGTSLLYKFDKVRQNLPNSRGQVRQNLPVGSAKSADHLGNSFRLTNKEPINNPEPADPERVRDMLKELKKTLSTGRA